MADVKLITNSELLTAPTGDVVLKNKIEGVYGRCHNNFISLEKALWGGVLPLYNITSSMSDNGKELTVITSTGYTRIDSNWRVNFDIDVEFKIPTFVNKMRVAIIWNGVDFYFGRQTDGYIANYGLAAIDYVENLPVDRRNIQPPPNYEITSPVRILTEYEEKSIMVVSNTDNYRFKKSYSILSDKQSKVHAYYSTVYGFEGIRINSSETQGNLSYYPVGIEVTLIGQEMVYSDFDFQHGKTTNAVEMPQNTLLTTKSVYRNDDGTTIPLYQYLADRKINAWGKGKKVMVASTVVDSPDMLYVVGDRVKLINARADNITDENAQSYQRNADGTAKVFEVVVADFVADGSHKQRLELQEKKE